MAIIPLLGLVLVVLAVVGIAVAQSRRRRDRPAQVPGRPRGAEPAKSRLTLISELTGIAGFVLTIVGFLLR